MLDDIPNPEDVDAEASEEKIKAIDDILQNAQEKPNTGPVTEGQMHLGDYDLENTEVEKEAYDNTMAETGAGAPDPPEDSDLPYNEAYDTDASGVIHDEVLDMFSASYDFGKVEVSAEEKERYMRSALTDSPLYFDVQLPGVPEFIRVYQPNTMEHAAASDAASVLMESEFLQQPNRWLLHLQRFYIHLQIERIGMKAFNDYDREVKYTSKELVNYLTDGETVAYLNSMQKPRYDLLVLAMKVAERKVKLCNDGLMTADFFATASTD